MDTPILIFGTQSKARIALEIFQCNGVIVYGLLDEKDTPEPGLTYSHVPVLGHMEEQAYLDLLGEKCHAFVAIENPSLCRETAIALGMKDKLHPLNAIHPSVYLAKEAKIGTGNIIHVGSSIGAEVIVHNQCTLMGHNMVGHGAILHDFVHLGAGALINPGVVIHEEAYIGSGAILNAHVTIGAKAHIASGAVVMENIPEGAIVSGNPAKIIKDTSRNP